MPKRINDGIILVVFWMLQNIWVCDDAPLWWQSVYSLAGRIRIDWTKWSIITNYVANTHVWKIYFNEPFFIVVNQLICALSVKSCIGNCDLCNEYDRIWLELISENASVAVLFRCLCPYPRYAEQFTGKFWAMTTKHYPSFLFYSILLLMFIVITRTFSNLICNQNNN